MIVVLMALIATSMITTIIYPSIQYQLVLRKELMILSVTFVNPYMVGAIIPLVRMTPENEF
ncbi:hypothetical protein [Paenibacillus alvei]|uniref:hypothetical protein n=1 Tax=Paenibacillus alvei TaxID=44250 RepID=UPI0013DA5F3A|nr:hypothetical protein [Paenibacillus alvei]NEZ41052.1 hypothetical protein [Paenibacillus alvei]